MAALYHATHKPLKKFNMGPFALNMLIKNRLTLLPERIEGIDQLRAILKKAKSLEGV